MVVGGGPAGMWAAKMAGRRGHEVTLYDRNEALGGQVRTAMKGAGRDEFGVIIRNEKDQVDKAGVKVELGVEVTAERCSQGNPDAVIVATGSVPKPHPVGGADGPGVCNVWQVLEGEARGRREGLPDRLRRPSPGHRHRRVSGRPGEDRSTSSAPASSSAPNSAPPRTST